jgi:hypothetical protein
METIIKERNKNYKIDLTNRRITLLDSRFYYDEDGKPCPSITTYLECYPKNSAYYEWLKTVGKDADMLRDEGGRRGSVVHGLTERYDKGEKIDLMPEGLVEYEPQYKLNDWACFERYVEFRKRFEIEIHSMEENLVNSELNEGGTLDRDLTLILLKKRYLVDIKASNNIWAEYWIQLAAYQRLKIKQFGYNPYHGRAILWLNAKTRTDGSKGAIQGKGWQLIINEDDPKKDLEIFDAVKLLWHQKNGDQMPRQVSYSLTHKKADVMLAEYKPNDKVTIIS